MQISVRTAPNDLMDSLERTDGKMNPKLKPHESFVNVAGRAAMKIIKKKKHLHSFIHSFDLFFYPNRINETQSGTETHASVR